MNNIPTSAVLDAAADAIQMAGWAQGPGGWHDRHGGGLCLEGGIMAASGVVHDKLHTCPAYKAVREYLAPMLAEISTCEGEPWYFNDKIAESADDVIAVLRAAAAVERLKESTPVYETEDQPLPLEAA